MSEEFVVETDFAKDFAKFLFVIKDEFVINITESGFDVKLGGREQHTAVVFRIDKKYMKEFNVKPCRIGIDAKQFSKILGSLTGEWLTFQIEEAEIIMKTEKQKAKLRLIDVTYIEGTPEKINMELETELDIDNADLKDVIKNAKGVGRTVELAFDGKELLIKTKGTTLYYESKVKLNKAIKNAKASASFMSDYLEMLLSGNTDDNIIMKFGEQKAIEMHYRIGDAEVTGMIAPYVDKD